MAHSVSRDYWRVILFSSLSFVRGKTTENLNSKYRRLSVILGFYLNVYLSSQKVRTVFFYARSYGVFSTVKFIVPVFLVFSFHGTSEFSKKKNGSLLSMNNHRAPWLNRWTIHRIVHSVTDSQCSTYSFGYYLKVIILRLCLRLIL